MQSVHGITGQPAPELRVDTWLANVDGDRGLRLADIDEPIVYLYNFQAWCPGCHNHGFPTMAAVKDHFESTGQADRVKFVAIQTVFEGHDTNTADAALDSVARHHLCDIALGHESDHPPTIMADYLTGGTPWTVIIGPDRTVLADGFQVDARAAIDLIESALPPTSHDPAEPDATNREDTMADMTPEAIRERLTPQQFEVTQNSGTERAFTGEYWDTKDPGVYGCIVCETSLFESDAKYDSGTGWPSFSAAIGDDRVARIEDRGHGMVRTEARCATCDAHLGHVFPDGPQATGERFCMNSASLRLEASATEYS
jgi:peptide-methionine (R)-S-oxide reductase